MDSNIYYIWAFRNLYLNYLKSKQIDQNEETNLEEEENAVVE